MTFHSAGTQDASSPRRPGFGSGLTEAEVRRFQTLLTTECGADVPLPEAWSRAITLLSVVELLLNAEGATRDEGEMSTEFALPPS